MRQRFGASLGGPLNIPGIYKGGSRTFFFVNYNGSRGDSPYTAFSTVPTLPERSGDFSAAGVQLVNPGNGQPIPGYNFQTAGLAINPIALGLLQFIPLPNVTPTSSNAQNFRFVTSTLNDSDDLNVRVIQALGAATNGRQRGRRGPRNNLNVGFHYHSASANVTNPFPSVGGTTNTRSFDVPIGYTRTFGKVVNNARLDFNRSRIGRRISTPLARTSRGRLASLEYRRILLIGACRIWHSPTSGASTTPTRNCCATRPGRFPTT